MTTSVLPVAFRQRPMTLQDVGGWAELLAAVEAVDRRGESYDADDCAEELTDPEIDLADTALVFDGEQPVAYQVLRRRTGDTPRLFADAAVHPGHRGKGVGTALLAAARRRATELGSKLTVRVAEGNAGAVELARGSGLVPLRWWSELVRDLSTPVVAAALPADLTGQPLGPTYDADRWDEPLRAAHNAAFADHWGSVPVTAQAWAHGRTASRNFRPGASVAALTPDGAIAGYVLSYEFVADTARTGVRDLYVAAVGTVRERRGRGIAGALLAHVLAAAVADGYRRSSLTVDTQNPTGALGVYERAGYALDRREITFASPG